MKILTTAATLAAILVSAGTAMAHPAPGTTPPPASHRSQMASNQNLRVARRHVERAIDRLQHDTEDYGGHREKAIDDLGLARQYLDQGLDYRASHGNTQGSNSVLPGGVGRPVPVNPGTSAGNGTSSGNGMSTGTGGNRNEFERGQAASNQNLLEVRRQIEAAIDALNSDASDYGGFKERAIDRLQAARGEIEAALDFVHRSGVQNGGSGQHVSDANLRFVNENIQAATTRLEQDRADYGGHRVAAIGDLNTARGYINSALQYDATHTNTSAAAGTGVMARTGNIQPALHPSTIGQGASNDSLADARSHVETAIDALSRDAHDYGGFRVKAIDALQAARNQLLQALQFRKTM